MRRWRRWGLLRESLRAVGDGGSRELKNPAANGTRGTRARLLAESLLPRPAKKSAVPALLETVVDEQATDAECCENQAEEDISRVSAVVHDAVALPDGQREHQNHKNEIEGFVHKRSFPDGILRRRMLCGPVKKS
jgi:hypothetical protein